MASQGFVIKAQQARQPPQRAPPPPPQYREPPPRPQPSAYQQPPQQYPQQYRPAPEKRKKKGLGKIIAVLVIFLILALILLFPPLNQPIKDMFANFGDYTPGAYKEYPASSEFTVIRTINFDSSQSIDYEIDIPIPKDISNTQEMVSISADPSYQEESKYGYDWMVWNSSGTSASIVITYTFREYAVYIDMGASDSGTADAIPQNLKDRYLGDEWKILPSDPEIKSLAEQLTDGEETVYGKVRAIYDYMVDNYEYAIGRDAEPQECTETLSLKKGDCDDQSILFCSLCRAVGIPAWMKFGLLNGGVSGDWQMHGWVTLYMPMASGDGGTVTIDVVNKEFLFRDAYRYTEFESDGVGDHMIDYYNALYYTYVVTPGGPPQVRYSDDTEVDFQESDETIKISTESNLRNPELPDVLEEMRIPSLSPRRWL